MQLTATARRKTFEADIFRTQGEVDIVGPKEWYAIYTRHHHEKVVAHHLEALGFEVYLPLRTEVHQWKDRHKMIVMPLFPSYVFFIGDLKRRFEIMNVPSVRFLVGSAGKAATIPESELAAVRRIVEIRKHVEPHPFLRRGERARIHTGPLAGIEGIVVRKKDSLSLVLSVELLGRSVAIDVDEADVETISGA